MIESVVTCIRLPKIESPTGHNQPQLETSCRNSSQPQDRICQIRVQPPSQLKSTAGQNQPQHKPIIITFINVIIFINVS